MIDWTTLPDWVKYVATDADGEQYGYEFKPRVAGDQWIVSQGRVYSIAIKKFDFTATLQERPR